MRKRKFDFGLQKLIANLKPMTWRQRIDHLWTYYRDYLFFAGAFLFVVVFAASAIFGGEKPICVSGALANVEMSDEGYYYLTKRYSQSPERTSNGEVTLYEVHFEDLLTTGDLEADYTAAVSLIAMVEAKSLDYMIMDRTAMEYYVGYDIFMDLREILTEEELESWGRENIRNAEPEGQDAYPFALRISHTEFAADCMPGQEDIYIAFLGNTPRSGACRAIWDHIGSWDHTSK